MLTVMLRNAVSSSADMSTKPAMAFSIVNKDPRILRQSKAQVPSQMLIDLLNKENWRLWLPSEMIK